MRPPRRALAFSLALMSCTAAGTMGAIGAPPDVAVKDLAFLAGRWTIGEGDRQAPGSTLRGQMEFTLAPDGQSLTMHDKASIAGPDGSALGAIDTSFRIWREEGALHGIFTDQGHDLHYLLVSMEGAKAVFDSDPAQNGAVLRLGFELTGPRSLTVTRGFKGEGQKQFGETTETLERAAP
jgi:hypothetical protein